MPGFQTPVILRMFFDSILLFCVIQYVISSSISPNKLITLFYDQLAGADRDDDEVYLRKIWISKLPQLIERLRNNCLFINIDTSARPTDNATEFLNNSIMQHLTVHNITIPSSTDPLITRANQPELQANFYRIPWQLVKIGYSKSNSHGPSHTLTASDIPYHDMTWHKLISNQAGTRKELHRLPNPINNCSIIFICKIHSRKDII